jgi:hypothetical protein
MIGRAGLAGPMSHRGPQIHFGIFSRKEMMTKVDPRGGWTVIDGTGGGRFANRASLEKEIDTDKNGQFSREELQQFYSLPGERDLARTYVVLCKSEFSGTTKDWLQSLKSSPDFKDMKGLESIVEEQITPTLWWDDRVAKGCGLPRDGVVYHYNPISVLRSLNVKLLEGDKGNESVGKWKKSEVGDKTPDGVSEGDRDGEEMIDPDEVENEVQSDIDIKRLVKGFMDK